MQLLAAIFPANIAPSAENSAARFDRPNLRGADMTAHSPSTTQPKALLARVVAAPATRTAALLALCAAYIQGPLTKIFDFNGALAEMDHFGLHPAAFFAVAVIVFELTASAMVVSGL